MCPTSEVFNAGNADTGVSAWSTPGRLRKAFFDAGNAEIAGRASRPWNARWLFGGPAVQKHRCRIDRSMQIDAAERIESSGVTTFLEPGLAGSFSSASARRIHCRATVSQPSMRSDFFEG